MTATVKAWHYDDCRRLSIDIEQIKYHDLKKKLQNTFQLENEFTVKYTDMDGDLCTISGAEEFEDLVNSDLVKGRKGTVRLQVFPNRHGLSSNASTISRGASRRASILHRRDSSDSGTSTLGDSNAIFDNQYTDCDMLEILRDISLFICARGMDRHGEHENAMAELPPGASSWVSAGKNLITPTTAQNFQRLNHARAVRAKFPLTNGAELLKGLDGHVHNWTVDTTGQWLKSNGYEDTVQIFKDHDITGDVLLELTHDTLKDMGVTSTGRRIRLLKMITELRLYAADLAIQEEDEAQALESLHIN
ncbi:Adaptor for signal transduction [Lobosporangium transversale]|nr:Adaptor for signal transduction [Lobosporangium transversale]